MHDPNWQGKRIGSAVSFQIGGGQSIANILTSDHAKSSGIHVAGGEPSGGSPAQGLDVPLPKFAIRLCF